MFERITDVLNVSDNKIIYEGFETNVRNNQTLWNSFYSADGFGEPAFTWNWKLLVDEMPDNFKFLEIGVYKGRVLSQVGMLSRISNKNCSIYGVTPLSTDGDKYSGYPACDYLNEIKNNFQKLNGHTHNLNIIKGFSQDDSVLKSVGNIAPFDMIFIDGSHDYVDVCNDIKNYLPFLKSGGYLVMDDASLYIDNPYGQFLGHPDVGKAIQDLLDNNNSVKHLYAVGHNRVWKHT